MKRASHPQAIAAAAAAVVALLAGYYVRAAPLPLSSLRPPPSLPLREINDEAVDSTTPTAHDWLCTTVHDCTHRDVVPDAYTAMSPPKGHDCAP
jgi:hypothetical protein